jgi:hypothetical protein
MGILAYSEISILRWQSINNHPYIHKSKVEPKKIPTLQGEAYLQLDYQIQDTIQQTIELHLANDQVPN